MKKNEGCGLVVISQAFPSERSGIGIAVGSALQVYSYAFSTVRLVVVAANDGCIGEDQTGVSQAQLANLLAVHVPLTAVSPWSWFVRSLGRTVPAISGRFLQPRVKAAIFKAIDEAIRTEKRLLIIIEDLPLTALLPELRERYKGIPVAVRSENVAGKIFESLADNGPLLSRLAWRYEVQRIERLEREAFKQVDRFWAITAADAQEYHRRYRVDVSGVFGVCLDAAKYRSIPAGDPETLLYLGSADLRKADGLRRFLSHSWPLIRNSHPRCKLLLAGRNTERFTDRASGIKGVGFIEQVEEFLGRGMLFINPQVSGSGIQLKSVVALLSAKTLVSMPLAVEGIPGESGRDFVVASSFRDMGKQISGLIGECSRAREIAASGRKLASALYSRERLLADALPLVEDFVTRTCLSQFRVSPDENSMQ